MVVRVCSGLRRWLSRPMYPEIRTRLYFDEFYSFLFVGCRPTKLHSYRKMKSVKRVNKIQINKENRLSLYFDSIRRNILRNKTIRGSTPPPEPSPLVTFSNNKSNRTTMRPLGIYLIGISIYILDVIQYMMILGDFGGFA